MQNTFNEKHFDQYCSLDSCFFYINYFSIELTNINFIIFKSKLFVIIEENATIPINKTVKLIYLIIKR